MRRKNLRCMPIRKILVSEWKQLLLHSAVIWQSIVFDTAQIKSEPGCNISHVYLSLLTDRTAQTVVSIDSSWNPVRTAAIVSCRLPASCPNKTSVRMKMKAWSDQLWLNEESRWELQRCSCPGSRQSYFNTACRQHDYIVYLSLYIVSTSSPYENTAQTFPTSAQTSLNLVSDSTVKESYLIRLCVRCKWSHSEHTRALVINPV